jgi:iron only hydrogenase large subunit-like protein
MPCFDKKLEASRSELTASAWSPSSFEDPPRDVDCVITTREILLLASSRNISLSALPTEPVQQAPFPDPTISSFLFPTRSSKPDRHTLDPIRTGTSGGNLSYIISTFLASHPGSSLVTTPGRNADVTEYTILSADGSSPVLRAARYYGFRNIQNLVRRLKPPKTSKLPGARVRAKPGASGVADYAYVEVMACPGGCTNGGGQIKPSDAAVDATVLLGSTEREKEREWLAKVDEAYFSSDDGGIPAADTSMENERGDEVDGISSGRILDYLRYWAEFTGIDLHRLVKTSYREVESDVGKEQHVVEIAGKAGGGW